MRILIPVLMLLFMLAWYKSEAQLIANKLNVYAGASLHSMPSQETSTTGDFTMPSLYGNMQNGYSFSYRLSYRVLPFVSTGLGYTKSNFYNWQSASSVIFKGASSTTGSVSALIMLHTPFAKKGLFNRMRLTAHISPKWGRHQLQLVNTPFVFDNQSSDADLLRLSSDSYVSKGFESAIGLEFLLNRNLGMYGQYGFSQTYFNARFHNDTSFRYQFVEAGLFLRMLKNKRYYY
jgi:hypothetical protein